MKTLSLLSLFRVSKAFDHFYFVSSDVAFCLSTDPIHQVLSLSFQIRDISLSQELHQLEIQNDRSDINSDRTE